MPYGISVYNSSSTLIISETYTNYHVISSGSIASGGSWPTLGTGELLYVRAATAGAVLSGSSFFNGSNLTTVTVSDGNIEYVIVKRTPSAASNTYGLRIYQSNGTSIAFDSGRAPAKIVSVYYRSTNGIITNWNATISQPFSVPTGRKRYMSAGFIAAPCTWDEVNNNYYHNYITWTNNNSQTIGFDAPEDWFLRDVGVEWPDYIGYLAMLTIDI